MSKWKCISSGNVIELGDELQVIEEMKRNSSYVAYVEPIPEVKVVADKKKDK